jgi:hypothetical protein
MNKTSPSERSPQTPADRVDDIPALLNALTLAVQEALVEHKRAGNPVAIWRNDRVEWVQPEDIPIPDTGGTDGNLAGSGQVSN